MCVRLASRRRARAQWSHVTPSAATVTRPPTSPCRLPALGGKLRRERQKPVVQRRRGRGRPPPTGRGRPTGPRRGLRRRSVCSAGPKCRSASRCGRGLRAGNALRRPAYDSRPGSGRGRHVRPALRSGDLRPRLPCPGPRPCRERGRGHTRGRPHPGARRPAGAGGPASGGEGPWLAAHLPRSRRPPMRGVVARSLHRCPSLQPGTCRATPNSPPRGSLAGVFRDELPRRGGNTGPSFPPTRRPCPRRDCGPPGRLTSNGK